MRLNAGWQHKALAVAVLLCGVLSAGSIVGIIHFRSTFTDMTLRQAWMMLVWVAEFVFVGNDGGISIPVTDYLEFAALCAFHILGVLLAVQNLRSGGEGARFAQRPHR